VNTVRPAICVSTPAPGPRACLEALASQTDAPVIVSAGLGRDQATALERFALALCPRAEVLHTAGPGLGRARNAALAACESEVLALLDDDIVVRDDWLRRLEQAWARAAEETGAIGGPIGIECLPPRPAWLTDSLLATLGTVDYGAETRPLDTALHTLRGGNLSFRATALRGVGGFWPARGHRADGDWFSEEHHAQRELARAGWDVSYEPGLVATRIVEGAELTARAMLRRRFRYGARLGLVGGGRTPGEALSQAARSFTGAATAAMGRQPGKSVERAARVAENLGVLVAPLVAWGDFQPQGASPFRASLPQATPSPLTHRLRSATRPLRRRGRRAAILLYHRVAEREPDPLALCVLPAHFSEQLEVLRSERRMIGLGELVDGLRSGDVSNSAVAITFDDGYADVLTEALPRLLAVGAPATLFACTGLMAGGRAPFWDELVSLLLGEDARPEGLEVECFGQRRAWRTRTPEQRAIARRHLNEWIQPLPAAEREAALAQVRAWSAPPPAAPGEGDRFASPAELRAATGSCALLEVGAHTLSHVSLGVAPEPVQRREVAGSREALEQWLGAPVAGFSYPFGVPGVDFTDTTRRVVVKAGFAYAVCNAPGTVSTASDLYALPRYVAPDVGGEEFLRWLNDRCA